MPTFLDFEKPIAELEGKIEELRHAVLDAREDAQPLVRWDGGEGRVFGRELHLLRALPAGSPRDYSATLSARGSWTGPEGEVSLERVDAGPGLPELRLYPAAAERIGIADRILAPPAGQTKAHWQPRRA